MQTRISVFLIVTVIFLILVTGCTSPSQKSSTEPIAPSSVSTQMQPNTQDSKKDEVNEAYHTSSNEILDQMKSVSNALPLEKTITGQPYSRSELELKGASLKNIADKWHKQMVLIKDIPTKDEEMTRNTHLQYLMGIKDAGSDIEEAAKAEALNEYSLAEDYATKSKVLFKNIKGIPDSEHKMMIETLIRDLDDYKLKMNHQIS